MKKFFPLLVLTSALALATVAAYYSVFGISKLFSSQAQAVILMAGILEASKLITASYLERYWNVIYWFRKVYLVLALLILMFITSLGIYGFLVSAYQETAYKVQEVEKKVEVENAKLKRYQEQLVSITTEKSSLNKNITELTTGLSNNKIQYTNSEGVLITTTSSSTRKALEKQLDNSMTRRDTLSKKEQIITDSISSIDLKILSLETNSDVAAEIGPLKYVAKITGKDTDKVVNWFILLFIFVFDPLAIILLISANRALYDLKPKKNIYGEIKTNVVKEEKVEVKQEESKAERVKAPTPPPTPLPSSNYIKQQKEKIIKEMKKIESSGVSSKKGGLALRDLKNKLKDLDNKSNNDLQKEY